MIEHKPATSAAQGRFTRTLLVLAGLVYTAWELWKLIAEIRRGLRR
jgi:hypothetical protein